MAPFAFLTNHGLALLAIAEDPRIRLRDIAATIGITERAAQRIVSELIAARYVDRTRKGRRNEYAVRTDLSIVLPNQRDVDLGSLIKVLLPAEPATSGAPRSPGPPDPAHRSVRDSAARPPVGLVGCPPVR